MSAAEIRIRLYDLQLERLEAESSGTPAIGPTWRTRSPTGPTGSVP
jgi:hypothetical protein